MGPAETPSANAAARERWGGLSQHGEAAQFFFGFAACFWKASHSRR